MDRDLKSVALHGCHLCVRIVWFPYSLNKKTIPIPGPLRNSIHPGAWCGVFFKCSLENIVEKF